MSGRELPDPHAKASKPGGRASPRRGGARAKGMPGVTPRLGSSCQTPALLYHCRAAPGRSRPRAAFRGRATLLLPGCEVGKDLSSSPLPPLSCPPLRQPLHVPAPSGLVHCTGVTRCNFHTLDAAIFVWLLARHLNMSAVPSTDSCAVSSPPASIQTASRGCWLFPACL